MVAAERRLHDPSAISRTFLAVFLILDKRRWPRHAVLGLPGRGGIAQFFEQAWLFALSHSIPVHSAGHWRSLASHSTGRSPLFRRVLSDIDGVPAPALDAPAPDRHHDIRQISQIVFHNSLVLSVEYKDHGFGFGAEARKPA